MNGDWESRLIQDLARLRRQPPFRVDVTARVLSEVSRLGPPPRETAASHRVLVWAAVAGTAAGMVLVVLLLPGLPAWIGDLGRTAGQIAEWGGGLFRGLATVLGWVVHGVAKTVDFVSSFRGLAGVLEPLVVGAVVAALAGMAGITAYVVGRDLLRGRVEAV